MPDTLTGSANPKIRSNVLSPKAYLEEKRCMSEEG
jgi:hypothetical protein